MGRLKIEREYEEWHRNRYNPKGRSYTVYSSSDSDDYQQATKQQRAVRTDKQKAASRANITKTRRITMTDSHQAPDQLLLGDQQQPICSHDSMIASDLAGQSQHRRNMENEHSNWLEALPQLRSSLLQFSPLRTAEAVRERQLKLQSKQKLTNESCNTYVCCRPHANEQVAAYPITYFSMHCRHLIYAPEWRCRGCNKTSRANAVHAGCWPLTPAAPQVWLDLDLLEEFASFSQKKGVSVTAFLDHVQTRQESIAAGDHLISDVSQRIRPRISSETFHRSFLAFLCAFNNLTILDGHGICLVEHKPRCPIRPQSETDQHERLIAADANPQAQQDMHQAADIDIMQQAKKPRTDVYTTTPTA